MKKGLVHVFSSLGGFFYVCQRLMKKGLVHVFSSLGVILCVSEINEERIGTCIFISRSYFYVCQRLMKKGLVHVFSSLGVIFMYVRD